MAGLAVHRMGVGLYPVCVSITSLHAPHSQRMCVCVHVFLYMHDGLEFLALGPVRGIAEGVHLIQFRYGSVENGRRVCVYICVCEPVCLNVCLL